MSFRFRKLKEEESRRNRLLEQAKQAEQAGTESGALDGKQDSGVSAGDSKEEQESNENEPIIANSNGGLSNSTNERTPNRNTKEETIQEAADSHSSVSNPASPDDHKSRDHEDGKDAA